VKITSCVPLAGRGVIARYGSLVAVTDGHGPDPDPLLGALTEAAASAGDGGDFVLRAARAALGCYGLPAWACAGITTDGDVAVLVHGRAVATVRVDGGQEITLTASDSVIPVSRKFAGGTVILGLCVGDPAAPDPQFWLGDGVACGGGLAVTVTADVGEMARPAPDALAPAVVPQHPAGGDDPGAVLVDGVLCPKDHFTDPGARACRQCGIGLDQTPRNLKRRQRPPLGVLVLDDGTRVTLDVDYVLGREPVFDSDVIDGRARPLRINDSNGTVSRLHLRISLVGWQVEVSDLGSANGSVLQSSGMEWPLAPFEPTIIEPGARIGIGHRSMQYLAYQGVLP
jgi:hypothetical protein